MTEEEIKHTSFRDWFLHFVEEQWTILLLFILLILLAGAHAFMIHFDRDPAVITWVEGMITGTFSAILMKLK